MRDLREFRTIVFDCDGVILNSNAVKTEAFYRSALPYGEDIAARLRDYHVENGGISRYAKFRYLIEELAGGTPGPSLDELLQNYALQVREGLLCCDVAAGLQELRALNPEARWLVASGGDQSELRWVFNKRNIEQYFDGGIYGSPATKEEILDAQLGAQDGTHPALFLGDSTYDWNVASDFGLEFVFMTDWTELPGWDAWLREHNLISTANLVSLIDAQNTGE